MLLSRKRVSYFLSALFLLGTFVPTTYAMDTINIGIDLPLTGAYSSMGVDSLAGVQFLESQISEKGGILAVCRT